MASAEKDRGKGLDRVNDSQLGRLGVKILPNVEISISVAFQVSNKLETRL